MNPLEKLVKNEERLFDLAVSSFKTYKFIPKCHCGRTLTERDEVKYFMEVGECFSHGEILDGAFTVREAL